MKLEDFFSGLDTLFAQKDIAAAEGYLAHHLEEARNCGNTGYQLAVLNEQAGLYRTLSRFPQAFMAGEQAMAIISAPDFTDRISAATTMLNVATALRAGGRITEALEMYGTVNEIYAAALDANDARRAALYNNMAQACMINGDKKTALEYLHKSLAILETSQENGAELATSHSNIALLYMSLGNNDAAATHLQAAMSGFEALGYDDAHYPAALAAMAQLMYIKGNYSGSVEQYRLALNKTEAVFGQNADYARICRNCARACSMAGMQLEAEELEKKAEAVERKLNSVNAPVQRSRQ
jgi:tetratricopeptide (TPR) repeat protein